MTVIGLIVLAVVAVVAVAMVLSAALTNAENKKGDAEKILGTWVDTTETWRFVFRDGRIAIAKNNGSGFGEEGELEYRLNEKSHELAMADAEIGAKIYGYALNGDTLTLTYQSGDLPKQSWTFTRDKS